MSSQIQRQLGVAALSATVVTGALGLMLLVSEDAAASPPAGEVEAHEFTRLSVPIPEGMIVNGGGPPPTPTADPEYVYVNMDGTNIICNGNDDAVANSSWIACQYGFSGNYPSWGGTAAQRQSIMDATKQDWAPFNVVVTESRPVSGTYTMCLTGPANHPFGNGVLGIAPLDCNDQMPSNVVFAFHSASQLGQFGANTQATTISQEVAHAYGLEHVSSSSDIMNPYNQGGNPSFTDTCITLVSGQGQPIQCNPQHQQFCSAGQQNSYQELLGMFGANDPDTEAPNVVVSYPYDGDTFEIGASFTITCEANDNQDLASVQLWIDGAQMGGTKAAPPFAWEVTNIPEGSYEIYCIAADEWDNSAMSPVIGILVEQGGMPGDGGADSGGDSGGDSGSDSGGESGGEDSGGLPPGFGLDDSDSGCACASDGLPTRAPALMLLTLLGLPLLRRRQ
ncbi:Ig-like domain-containing protein [Enhygromyxa salina]|uniref:Ig-like domain-containing protein n=1 Tax=Enhygromyxa salina TaxID=215803 RepID=UPI000696F450|nr:Ig-like domain-containing protein [Enhygromyxa salina]